MRLFKNGKLWWWLGAAGIAAAVAAAVLAVPAYEERQRREQLNEAFRNLADIQLWMDAYYAHHRNYARAGACGAAVVPADRARYFAYSCAPDTVAGASPGQTYVATATGNSRLTNGFVFSIDEKKRRFTVAIPKDWGPLPAAASSRWLDRKG